MISIWEFISACMRVWAYQELTDFISRDTHVSIYISVACARIIFLIDRLSTVISLYCQGGPLGALFIFMCNHDSTIVFL